MQRIALISVLMTLAAGASAQPAAPRVEISGQIMLDAIYDFKRVDPDWNATLRPSTIPVNCPATRAAARTARRS